MIFDCTIKSKPLQIEVSREKTDACPETFPAAARGAAHGRTASRRKKNTRAARTARAARAYAPPNIAMPCW